MFNLEQAISEWRRKMLADGIKNPAVLDELESHLREDIERQIRSGANEDQACEIAARNIGRSDLLKAEFVKIGRGAEISLGKIIGTALCLLAAAFAIMAIPAVCTIREMSIAQRLLGFGAIGVVLLAVASWRFSYKFLPIIRSRRARMAASIGIGLAGALWLYAFEALLVLAIVPHVLNGSRVTSAENFFPVFTIGLSFLWAIALAATLGAVAYGLEEAGQRELRKGAYV